MTRLTVDDLLAREEIGDIVNDLARGTDRLDAELMASCYHPDGTCFLVDSASPSRPPGTASLHLRLHRPPHRPRDRDSSAARVCAFDWTVTVSFDPARGFGFEPGWTLGARDLTDITYQQEEPSWP